MSKDILLVVKGIIERHIIEARSRTKIVQFSVRNPGPSPSDLTLTLDVNGIDIREITGRTSSALVLASAYLSEFLPCDGNSLSVPIPGNIEDLDIILDYINVTQAIDGEKLYHPVHLYTMRPLQYMRNADAQWMVRFLFTHDGINWSNVGKLLSATEMASFLGIEPFYTYAFMCLYVMSCSLSCPERERVFGHRYFLLPIGDWHHPLRAMWSFPFLSEGDVVNCTDELHGKIGIYLDALKDVM